MASEINGWNPHDTRLAFTHRENGYELVMPYVNDTFEYKLSRGDWRKVEVDSEGKEVRNRIYYPGTDTVKIVVEGWRDTFEPIQQNSTASANVRFLPSTIEMKKLNRRKQFAYTCHQIITKGSNSL